MPEKTTVINNSEVTEDNRLFHSWLAYCKSEGLESKTIRGHTFNVERFLWWWHNSGNAEKRGHHLNNVGLKEAREYAAYLRNPVDNRWGSEKTKSKLAPYTVGNYSRSLKTFFNWMEAEGHIEASPFKKVSFAPKKQDRVIKHLNREQLTQLFNYLTDSVRVKTYTGKRNLAIVTLFLDSGMRLGELLSIQFKDLDFSNLRCTIRGKTGQRYALFSQGCKQVLQDYLKLRLTQGEAEGAFWYGVDGLPLSFDGLTSVMRRTRLDSGVKFHAHQLRHTFALLMSQRVSVFELKELMGHSSITTTQIYVQQNIDILGDRYRPNSPLSILKGELPGLQKKRRGRPTNTSRLVNASDV